MPIDKEKIKKTAKQGAKLGKEYYESKEDAFEGVREVGRAITRVTKSAAQVIGEKIPKIGPPPAQAANTVYKVEGPFMHMDMTPDTMMNNPKRYKKG